MIELRLHDCLQGAAFIILQTDPTLRRDALVALAQVEAKSFSVACFSGVMAGLVPAIHVFLADSLLLILCEDVDARDKAEHDDG